MKRRMKYITGFMMTLALLLGMVPAVNVKAEKAYTLTLRAGNVGTFDTAKYQGVDDNVEITANYIKYQIPRGSSLRDLDYVSGDAQLNALLNNIVTTEADYRLMQVEGVAEMAITRNTEYVLDYGKLVDPVSYSVYYVDSVSGEQIASPTLSYGNAGDVISDIAPLKITNYETKDTNASLTLDAGEENSVTFKYSYITKTPETETRVVTVTEPGDTVTQIETNEIPVITPGGAQVVTPEPENPLQNPEGEEPVANQEEVLLGGEDEPVEIEDEEVPLGGNEGEDAASGEEDADVTIGDEEVPLGGIEDTGSYMWLVFVGIFAMILAATVIGIILYKKKTVKK